MKIKVVKKHPLVLRWNHWLNFPLLTLMIVSGLAIYWANPAYLLPGKWIANLGLGYNLGLAIGWHFTIAVFFVLNGLCYFIFLLKTRHYQYLVPDRQTFKDAFQVVLHDLKIKRGMLPPQRKYNGAQKISYAVVFLLGVMATVTGLAIYKPIQLNWLVALLGGYKAARIEHFVVTILFVTFFCVHILQVIRAGWNNFRAMITGVEVVSAEKILEKKP